MIVKLSYIILFVLLLSVTLNAFYINGFTEKIYTISKASDASDIKGFSHEFQKMMRIYEENEMFVSLTVSHEDLTDIKQLLAEIEGAIAADDKNAVIIAKSRLESALLHLGQLSMLNIESVF